MPDLELLVLFKDREGGEEMFELREPGVAEPAEQDYFRFAWEPILPEVPIESSDLFHCSYRCSVPHFILS